MSSKYNVVLVWIICLSCKVVMTGCEVVWVNRNVTDSFRVGKDGCTNNTSVCTSSATCQSDGSCLCSSSKPSYRNPVLEFRNTSKKIVYNDSYGCNDNFIILLGVSHGIDSCPYKIFEPFQVIPYSHNDSATKFMIQHPNATLNNCFVTNVWAKFPNNATEMELHWLNESYVNLTVSNKTLYFKWKRSVPDLQGTILTFNLSCQSSSKKNITYCLRAKVFKTWSAGNAKPSITKSTTSELNSPSTTTTSPTSSATSNLSDEVSSSDGVSSETIIIIAAVVPAVLLIVLVIVVCVLCKRKRARSQRNPSHKHSEKKNETSTRKQFRHTDSTLRGPLAYVDMPESDKTGTFGAHANPAGPTSENQSAIVEENPRYGTADFQNDEVNQVNFYSDPEYEPDEMTRVNGATFQSAHDYATVDIERKKDDAKNFYQDPGYETPDIKRKDEAKNSYADPGYATVDIERKDVAKNSHLDHAYDTPEVDGSNSHTDPNYENVAELVDRGSTRREENAATSQPDLGHGTPDMKKKEVNEDASDSAYSTPEGDAREVEENAGLSTPDIKRIEINGDLYALPDKNK